jgi:pyridine nucleotide-disulfide oxidoreductase family protein
VTRLLLAGGGHAHVFVLRALAQRRPANLDVTLVTPTERQLYSGMLPGWIAGHYALDDLAIPLRPLVQAAGARIALDRIVGLDANAGSAVTARGGRFDFDRVSIAVGSDIATTAIEGAGHALRLRPIEDFVARWAALAPRLAEAERPRVTVIGAGAGGVEVALAVAYRLRAVGNGTQVQLVSGGQLLPAHGAAARARVLAALMRAQVRVVDSLARRIHADHIDLADGAVLPSDATLLASGAAAPPWLRSTTLALDAGGFLLVDRTLRSLSSERVFGAGDAVSIVDAPRPRSGVYAVRAGPPLADNLLRAAAGQPLRRYTPQSSALYLLATGPQHAIGSWRQLAWEGAWAWRWKDRIDRGFIAQFRSFP